MSLEKEPQLIEKRGRPLDLSRNKVILETTLDLVAEKGYDALTIDQVALKAKVGKGTIYRRWSSKLELVIEATTAMNPLEISKETANKNHDLREQLIDLLSLFFSHDNINYQKATNAICSIVSNNEQLEKGIREAFYQRNRNVIESFIKPHLKENQIADVDLKLIADIGPALAMYTAYSKDESTNASYVERIVDTVIMPILSKKF